MKILFLFIYIFKTTPPLTFCKAPDLSLKWGGAPWAPPPIQYKLKSWKMAISSKPLLKFQKYFMGHIFIQFATYFNNKI